MGATEIIIFYILSFIGSFKTHVFEPTKPDYGGAVINGLFGIGFIMLFIPKSK